MVQKGIQQIERQISNRKQKILGEDKGFRAAVLVPLLEENGETYVLFEKRPEHIKRQPGDVCFPGGRIETEDKNEQAAAVRETIEELGVEKTDIDIIAPLDIFIRGDNTFVYPFVGKIHSNAQIVPDPNEVEKVFKVPLEYFFDVKPKRYDVTLKPIPVDDFPYHLIARGKNYQWRTTKMAQYFYEYDGQVIWGMTARILIHMLDLIDNGR